jgi:hypothetical protein
MYTPKPYLTGTIRNLKLVAPCIAALLAAHAQAQITETTDDNGAAGTGSGVASDWNAALWGTPAAAPASGNTYVTAPNLGGGGTSGGIPYTTRVRINDAGGINTFQGNSIELVSGVQLLDKSLTGDGASGDLILDGGSLFDEAANTPGTTSLSGTIQVNSSGATAPAYLGIDQFSTTAVLNVNSTLIGSGTLDLFGILTVTPTTDVNTVNLNGNINSFDGTLNFYTNGTLGITTAADARVPRSISARRAPSST